MIETVPLRTPDRRATDVIHPALKQIEDLWQSLRAGTTLPKRTDIDPDCIDAALPWSFVLHCVAPGVARVRVAGQMVHNALRTDPRGMTINAFFGDEDRSTLAVHLEAMFTDPALVQLALRSPARLLRPEINGTMLLLPLLDGYGDVTRALGVLVTDRNLRSRQSLGLDADKPLRYEPASLYHTPPAPQTQRPDAVRPALRLVVNNG